MIILDVGDSVVAVLGEAASTQPDYYTSFIDTDDVPGNSKGVMTGVSEVTIVAAPITGKRMVDLITIYNCDAIDHIVTVMVANGANRYPLDYKTLIPKESLQVGKQKPSSHIDGADGTSSTLIRTNKTHTDSPVTLLDSDCVGYTVFTNTGAASEVIMGLPAGFDGGRVSAIITAAYDFTFVANGTETIRYLEYISKAGGSIKSAIIGHCLQLDWSGTQWVASVTGPYWNLETS